jgi:AraC family transcriptional regulator, transcriptional activator of pobA
LIISTDLFVLWRYTKINMQFIGSTNERLMLEEINKSNCYILKQSGKSELTLVWFTENGNKLVIDEREIEFSKNQVLCLTEFHRIKVLSIVGARMVRFNRSFFCILDHDSEIGCKGILFFGASNLPIIDLPEEELEKFEILWKMFLSEMQSKDELQHEMLQMMLKRLLILCTRLYKEKHQYQQFDKTNVDLVREFNFLVEQHFRSKNTVADYAEMLNKSPKTISNLFAKVSDKTPLQFIQERKMLEARRLLRYTDKPVKEIAYELGYEDIQAFSRFFKTQEQISPSEYRENQ